MTIVTVQPLYAGNALRLFIEPPAGAVRWKVLRKGSDSFASHDDPSALVAYDGNEKVVVDAAYLVNNQSAFYRPFYTPDGSTWTAGATASGTPAATYDDSATTDVLSLLRERIEAGLKVEVERGALQNDLGYIQVYTAPPSLEQNLSFPLVTLSLDSEAPSSRALGEDVSGDMFDEVSGDWQESEGWLADVKVSIVGWSLNSDERLELRKALRRVIVANLPVLAFNGIDQVELSMSDTDATSGEYGAPVYQVMADFSCVAPVRVSGRADAISAVILTIKE